MEDFRSDYPGDGRTQMEGSCGGQDPVPCGINTMKDLRCYSASYVYSVHQTQAESGTGNNSNHVEFKRGKSISVSSSKSWSFSDPELQRKKRVVSYKAYTVEAKVKRSLKRSFSWLKTRLVNRWH